MEQSIGHVVLNAPSGFHARPASQFAKLSKDFLGDITLYYGDRSANGKSVMNLLALGAGPGSSLKVEVNGPNAKVMLEALIAFLETMQ